MRNKIYTALLAVLVLLLTAGAAFAAAETERSMDPAAAETERSADPAAAETERSAAPAVLSDELYSFQVQIGSDVYTLPESLEKFLQTGWRISKSNEQKAENMLATNFDDTLEITRGDVTLTANCMNFDINEQPIRACTAIGLSVLISNDDNPSAGHIVFPGGIMLGASREEEILAAYGEPTEIYGSEVSLRTLSYIKEPLERVDFYVIPGNGLLVYVGMQNVVTPKDIRYSEADTSMPAITAGYQAPSALGGDYLDPIVEFCGDLYAVPCPLQALLDNGWTIVKAPDDAEDIDPEQAPNDVIECLGFGNYYLSRDNATYHVYVKNKTRRATLAKYCFVESFTLSGDDSKMLSLKLSGGLELGQSKAAVREKVEADGYYWQRFNERSARFAYTDESSEDHHVYIECYDDDDPDIITELTFKDSNMEGTEEETEADLIDELKELLEQ